MDDVLGDAVKSRSAQNIALAIPSAVFNAPAWTQHLATLLDHRLTHEAATLLLHQGWKSVLPESLQRFLVVSVFPATLRDFSHSAAPLAVSTKATLGGVLFPGRPELVDGPPGVVEFFAPQLPLLDALLSFDRFRKIDRHRRSDCPTCGVAAKSSNKKNAAAAAAGSTSTFFWQGEMSLRQSELTFLDLSMTGDAIAEHHLVNLARKSFRLKHLNLIGVTNAADGDGRPIKEFATAATDLEQLHADSAAATDTALRTVAEKAASRLKTLHIVGDFDTSSSNSNSNSDNALILLSKSARRLKELELENCGGRFTDESVLEVVRAHGRTLTSLKLSGSKAITDRVLLELAASGCGALSTLDVSNTSVTDAGVEAIAKTCSDLWRLNLANNEKRVSDRGILALARHTVCPMKGLDVRGARGAVTSESIKALQAACHGMVEAHFDSCDFLTDEEVYG